MVATVSGVIVLENPSPVPRAGGYLSFTGQMWISHSITLRGIYRYFNTYNDNFDCVSKHFAEVHVCVFLFLFVFRAHTVQVAKFVPCHTVEPSDITTNQICSNKKDLKDFYVAADIIQVRSITPALRFYYWRFIQLIPLGTEDTRQQLFIHASGGVYNCQKQDWSFELIAHQYISYFKPNPLLSHFPIHASFNPTKYKGKKPTPNNNTPVTIEGFVSDVIKDSNQHASHFTVTVDHIVFPPHVSATPSSNTGDS